LNREDEPPAKTWKRPPKIKTNIPTEAQARKMIETHKRHGRSRKGFTCDCFHCRPTPEETPLLD